MYESDFENYYTKYMNKNKTPVSSPHSSFQEHEMEDPNLEAAFINEDSFINNQPNRHHMSNDNHGGDNRDRDNRDRDDRSRDNRDRDGRDRDHQDRNDPPNRPNPPSNRPPHRPPHRPPTPPFPPNRPPHRPPTSPPTSNRPSPMPVTPPPNFIPERSFQPFRIDPGAIRNCLFRFTYIWQDNGDQYWMFPIQVGRDSVTGFRWNPRLGWTFFGVSLNRIASFMCT